MIPCGFRYGQETTRVRLFSHSRKFETVQQHRKVKRTKRWQKQAFSADILDHEGARVLALMSLAVAFLPASLALTVFRRPSRVAEDSKDVQPRISSHCYRALGYTPWPTNEGDEGDRVRVEVGPISARQKCTYLFDRILQSPSQVLVVSLPRPMGVVFEEVASKRQVVVADIVAGSVAYQRQQVAQLDRARLNSCVQKGDVLRACTSTNFVYSTSALFGAKPPERTVVLYGADGQRWSQVMNALKRGEHGDGPVTMVLERPI